MELDEQPQDQLQEICSLLIANGYIPKDQFQQLMYDDELRARVENRLDLVGLKLLQNVYSANWGVGLSDRTSSDERLEWSNNFGLERGAMALLLIIWVKLILPKRLAQEERQPEDGTVASLFPQIETVPQPRVSVNRDQIVAEFADLLGGITLVGKYLAQLSRAKLIRCHGGLVEEGPLLSLVVDETKLGDELRRDVLLSVLKREHSAGTALT
ncbi:MAG TPA: hypothetical protein DCR55_16330 [Lentisphaeria bacterium]|nr:hypothetical protein [Lentisphaeria bacterium]